MTTKRFKISGSFAKKGRTQTFSKEISSINKELALDKVYCLIGSNHKVKRRQIYIKDTEELEEPAESTK